MLQLNPIKKVYDVCIIGSGAGGGTAAKVLTEGGLNVVDARGRSAARSGKRFQRARVALPTSASRRRGRREGRRALATNSWRRTDPGRLTASLTPPPRARVPLVPLTHRRRPHQSLGTHCPALCSGGFQCAFHGRHGRRLADYLRRARSLLRQGRDRTSAFSDRRRTCPMRQTEFSCLRRSRAAPKPSSRKPATSSVSRAFRRGWRLSPRPLNDASLPLLRAMRPRMQYAHRTSVPAR